MLGASHSHSSGSYCEFQLWCSRELSRNKFKLYLVNQVNDQRNDDMGEMTVSVDVIFQHILYSHLRLTLVSRTTALEDRDSTIYSVTS